MKPQLIALHGPAGSGKTTAARMFVDWHMFAGVKFAGPLKNMFGTLLKTAGAPYEYTQECIDGAYKEQPSHYLSGCSPRQVMQDLGEWGRGLDPNFWVNPAMVRARGLMGRGKSVIIDDCRYENEAEAVLAAGGRVIKIGGRRNTRVSPEHNSERPLPDRLISGHINNTGSQGLLHDEVCRIIREGQA